PAAQLDRVGAGDVHAVDLDGPGRGLDQPVDHLEGRRLAGAGGADEDDQLTRGDVEVQLLDGHGPVGVGLADPGETDHGLSGSPIGNLHAVTLLAVAAGASASADGPTCYSRLTNEWICRQYVEDFRPEIQHATLEHLEITALSVLLGLVIAFPMALLARRFARLESMTGGVATAIYTIPSLALLPLMVPFTGLSKTTVVIALALYALTILVRSTLEGLRSVPDEVVESAL